MTRVLVTGANGFVGRVLAKQLAVGGYEVTGSLRTADAGPNGLVGAVVGEINAKTCWRRALQDIDVVVHLAARVHVMKETSADPLSAFRTVNAAGTANLARQCAAYGVKRLVYLSTIKVNGEWCEIAWNEGDDVNPQTPYALSKWEAEQALAKIGSATGLEIVVIRPPLVYGPGVKGNFLRLLKWVHAGLPIPLARADTARSMIGVDNLCDFIITCIDHPKAIGEVFLAADGRALSTPELVAMMAGAMRRSVRSVALPVHWLRALGQISGKQAEVERLCGSLLVDSRKANEILGWFPPVSVEQGVNETVTWFLAQKLRLNEC